MQVAAANGYGMPPSQSTQAAAAAVTAATAAINGQQIPPGVGGTPNGTAVQAALAAQQGAGLTAAALAQQVKSEHPQIPSRYNVQYGF